MTTLHYSCISIIKYYAFRATSWTWILRSNNVCFQVGCEVINYCEIRDKPFILWADYWKDYVNVDAIFFNLSLSQSCNFCCMTILTAVIQEALPGGGVPCRPF